jgi:D-alanyl-D-alanine carboxypeptidase
MQSPSAQQDLLDRFVGGNPDVPGVLLHMDGPTLQWSGAAGVRDRLTREPLTADATIRIASITKTYVAAAVLRLMELGRLGLDDPIGSHVGGEIAELLGETRCRRILIRHLLTHTSGLCDFVMDTDYQQIIMSDLHRRWTREDQVRYALDRCADVGEPGEGFHYSDTGYVLLGAVIERATGSGFAAGLRSLLRFEALGLTATYLESLEPIPADAGPRACQYVHDQDTYDADPSFDLWGGGGLVASMADVAAFYRALFEGRVYDRPDTLARMLEPAAVAEGAQIGMGIAGRTIAGHLLYGHGGYWGLYAGYLPDLDSAMSVAVLERDALPALAEELLPGIITIATG